MRSAWICTLFLCCGAFAWAQPLNKASYETMLNVAAEQMAKRDYYNALIWYEKAYEEKSDDSLIPLIAEMHYRLRDYVRAERSYDRLFRRDKENKFADLRFRYGRILKMNEKYDEAIPQLQQFIASTTNDTLRTLAKNELTGAEMALSMPQTTKGAKIEILGKEVNSSFSEYSAVLSRDGSKLYFSGFGDQKEVIVVDEVKPEFYARVFTASKGEKGWEKPEPLSEEINRPGFHVGNVSLSADGRTMYFTRGTLDGNVLATSKIYYSVGGDGSWGPAQEVKGVNGEYVAKNPAVGELFGRSVLFFSANIPGGFGGYDLYYATLQGEGQYGDPVNLGPRINTAANEETPFYREGTLYFSSDGHPGIGGFDIFYSTWNGERWSDPTNMGFGYNSSVDDRFFSLDAEGYNGSLTSNRPGGRSVHGRTCCDDIYSVQIPKIAADLVVGLFTADRQVLKGGTVSIQTMQNNRPGTPERQLQANGNRFGFDLALNMPYVVIAEHPDYFPDTASLNTAGLTASKTFEQRFYLKAKPKAPPAPQFDTLTIEEPIVLQNILYDLDSDRIRKEAETDLAFIDSLLKKYPEMRIELRSHTDYRGNDNYNIDLSQRRAESARRWLIRAGIPRERMEVKGYGETVPYTIKEADAQNFPFLKIGQVLTPKFIDDSLKTEEHREVAHEFNRRTEFKIIEGPTSIIIERTRLRKQENKPVPNRQQLPAGDTLKIHRLSSLFYKKDLKGVPIMDFEERIIAFGPVKKGEKREHVYRFTNRGDTDLRISTVVACDCTTTDYSTDPVKPGESAEIHVVFDSTEKDADETITIDIILENTVPASGEPIIERLQYSFELKR